MDPKEKARWVFTVPEAGQRCGLEVWPESHWPGFALREADVFKTYMAWWCM